MYRRGGGGGGAGDNKQKMPMGRGGKMMTPPFPFVPGGGRGGAGFVPAPGGGPPGAFNRYPPGPRGYPYPPGMSLIIISH